MNDSLIPVLIITEISSVLFYLEAWTKINGKMSCTQVKCSWILPSYVKEVEYGRVCDINSTSAKKLKTDLNATLDRVFDISQGDNLAEEPEIESNSVSAPSQEEMNSFFAELNNCKFRPIALSLVPPFSESLVLRSREIQIVLDLSDPKNQARS